MSNDAKQADTGRAEVTEDELVAIRADADFTARRVGAPGCDVRKLAEATLRLVAAYRRRCAEAQAPLPAWAKEGDGVDRLVRALHGRAPTPRDYLGGSEARMLHEAADRIGQLEAQVAELRRRARDAGCGCGSPEEHGCGR